MVASSLVATKGSLWKLNVRSCIAVLPLRTLLGLNPGTAMHMRRNSGMDETTPSDKGAFGQIQPSQQSRSSFGRCSTSSFPGSRCTSSSENTARCEPGARIARIFHAESIPVSQLERERCRSRLQQCPIQQSKHGLESQRAL